MDDWPTENLDLARELLAKAGDPALLRRWGVWESCVREAIIDAAIGEVPWEEAENTAAWAHFGDSWKNLSATQRALRLGPDETNTAQMFAGRLARIERFKELHWGAKISDYFLKRKSAIDKVIYSLIRHADLGIAWELFFRLQSKEATFAELASQYSQGQERLTGGTLGPVTRETPHPALGAVLAELKPGDLSPPRKLGDWFVILRLDKVIPATLDAETRKFLMQECFETWLTGQITQFVR